MQRMMNGRAQSLSLISDLVGREEARSLNIHDVPFVILDVVHLSAYKNAVGKVKVKLALSYV